MKHLILAIFLAGTTLAVCAQDLPANEEGKVVYEEVVQVDGATKDQLYRQARAWFEDSYTKGDQDEDVIYLSDSYLGEIGANPYFWVEVGAVGKPLEAGAVLYDIKVAVKDGRYKYRISNLYHEAQRGRLGAGGAIENNEPECGTLNMQQKYWEEIKTNTDAKMKELITELKASMAKAPEMGKDEDW